MRNGKFKSEKWKLWKQKINQKNRIMEKWKIEIMKNRK